MEAVAWDNYISYKKPARTEKAGPGFSDPEYDLSVEWKVARSVMNALLRCGPADCRLRTET